MGIVERIGLVLGTAILAACATVQVGDLTLGKDAWAEDDAELRARAAFEMNCPKEELMLSVLSATRGSPRFAETVGVTGCQQKAVYKRVPSTGWVLNSAHQGDQP